MSLEELLRYRTKTKRMYDFIKYIITHASNNEEKIDELIKEIMIHYSSSLKAIMLQSGQAFNNSTSLEKKELSDYEKINLILKNFYRYDQLIELKRPCMEIFLLF